MELVSVETPVVGVGVEKQGNVGEVVDLEGLHDQVQKSPVYCHLVHERVLLFGAGEEYLFEEEVELFFDVGVL